MDLQDVFLAEDYAKAATADNTKIAYQKDLDRFMQWGGKIPSSPEQVSAYLSEHAMDHKVATLLRWLTSISQAHKRAGLPTPTKDTVVHETLSGIRKIHGGKQRRVAPITTEELMAMVDAAPNTLIGQRNKALLLVGFGGAMRRSEITNLQVENFEIDRRGAVVDLGKTKTDQSGEDSKVAITMAKNKRYCAVTALKSWYAATGITEGPVFRAINQYGKLSSRKLSTQAVADIVKAMALAAGLDRTLFSGHSMRAGLATAAAQADKPYHKIKAITRHKSDATLARYIRDGQMFENNAGDLL